MLGGTRGCSQFLPAPPQPTLPGSCCAASQCQKPFFSWGLADTFSYLTAGKGGMLWVCSLQSVVPGLFLLYLWERLSRCEGTKGRKCSRIAGRLGHRAGTQCWEWGLALRAEHSNMFWLSEHCPCWSGKRHKKALQNEHSHQVNTLMCTKEGRKQSTGLASHWAQHCPQHRCRAHTNPDRSWA